MSGSTKKVVSAQEEEKHASTNREHGGGEVAAFAGPYMGKLS